MGEIASGLGPGRRVRIADIDGDGVGSTFTQLIHGANVENSSVMITST